MYQIHLLNNKGFTVNNLWMGKEYLQFTDLKNNTVIIPWSSIVSVVKLAPAPEVTKEEVEEVETVEESKEEIKDDAA